MGRRKAKKGPRRPRPQTPPVSIPRLPENQRFSSVGESVKNGTMGGRPQAVADTVRKLLPTYIDINKRDPDGPACDGPLLIHDDGTFECTAGCPGPLEVLHVPEALQYCDFADLFGIYADELDHHCPTCITADTTEDEPGVCTGTELDHEDGTTTCSLGNDCGGVHMTGNTCNLLNPCDRCGLPALVFG